MTEWEVHKTLIQGPRKGELWQKSDLGQYLLGLLDKSPG